MSTNAAFVIVAYCFLLRGSATPADVDPKPAARDQAKIFDSLNVNARIDAARRQAKRSGKPILVLFGSDWCNWCHRLWQTVSTDSRLSAQFKRYVIVTVDVGRFDKNLSTVGDCGLDLKEEGIPFLVVLNPRGQIAARISTIPFEKDGGYDAVSLSLELSRWSRTR